MLEAPGKLTGVNSAKYNRYHLLRKGKAGRQEAGSAISAGDRSLPEHNLQYQNIKNTLIHLLFIYRHEKSH